MDKFKLQCVSLTFSQFYANIPSQCNNRYCNDLALGLKSRMVGSLTILYKLFFCSRLGGERWEKMADTEKNKTGILEKIEFWITTITAVPILGIVLKNLFTSFADKGVEKLHSKVGEAFGLNSDEAMKTDKDDNALLKVLVKGTFLTPIQKKEIKKWIDDLQDTDPVLANELTKRIFNILQENTSQDEQVKGVGEKKKKKTVKNEADGILIAEHLLFAIIDVPQTADNLARLAVLRRNKIVVPAKRPAPAKEFVKKKFKEAVDGEKANRDNLNNTMSDWRKRSETWKNSK